MLELNNPNKCLFAVLVSFVQDVALFKEGFPANDAIRLMAEDGDNSGLLVRLLR